MRELGAAAQVMDELHALLSYAPLLPEADSIAAVKLQVRRYSVRGDVAEAEHGEGDFCDTGDLEV